MPYIGETVVIYPTYKQHTNAQRRDRPKHYPGAPIYVEYMKRRDQTKVYKRVFKSEFRADDAQRMTTREYVEHFRKLNHLT